MNKKATDWIHQHMPIRVQQRTLAKDDYNVIRLGILRLGNPLELELEDLKGISCILDDRAWVFMDSSTSDMPLLAWTNFQPRDTITDAITCELRLYHMHAGLLISKSLDALQNTIRYLLKNKYGDNNDVVVDIKR